MCETLLTLIAQKLNLLRKLLKIYLHFLIFVLINNYNLRADSLAAAASRETAELSTLKKERDTLAKRVDVAHANLGKQRGAWQTATTTARGPPSGSNEARRPTGASPAYRKTSSPSLFASKFQAK
jgi:hypothetical protein